MTYLLSGLSNRGPSFTFTLHFISHFLLSARLLCFFLGRYEAELRFFVSRYINIYAIQQTQEQLSTVVKRETKKLQEWSDSVPSLSLTFLFYCSIFLSHANIEIERRCKRHYHTVHNIALKPHFLGTCHTHKHTFLTVCYLNTHVQVSPLTTELQGR